MNKQIKKIAVIGSGTMGAGIAALAADKECKVLLLDITRELIEKAKEKIINNKDPMLTNPENIKNIEIGTFDQDFHKITSYDWICEAVVEKLDIKRSIFGKIEKYRNKDSIVSSNTSGIPLKDITKNMSEELLKNVCITHFFNPVNVMKLCELIPGENTSLEMLNNLNLFLINIMNKGVVYGKDTVNFIGNRIGCYFMLKGLHEGKNARNNNLNIEKIDSLLSKSVGIPPTGLYGLVDLIGLDVMYSVSKNLEINLPEKDRGLACVSLPDEELELYNNKQLGRKTGGGFYRIKKNIDGDKLKEVFDLEEKVWKPFLKETLVTKPKSMLEDTEEGNYLWNVMGSTLLYAADLIPQIADDIVNVDNAMKWGFAWNKGPFEMLDDLELEKVIQKCISSNLSIPKMLQILKESKYKKFYSNNQEFLNLQGEYEKIKI